MNLEDLWEEIESEQSWRIDELRHLHNSLNAIEDQSAQDRFRRVLVLMIYAHLEGYCKFCFAHYIRFVNDSAPKCRDVNSAMAAAAFHEVFQALRNPSAKCDLFRNTSPDDEKLHIFAREKEFFERFQEFGDRVVKVPDKFVDLESNLSPTVLRKLLFRCGLPHELADEIRKSLNSLLALRNRIAHGESRDGVSEEKYRELRDVAIQIMNRVKSSIMQSIESKSFLRV